MRTVTFVLGMLCGSLLTMAALHFAGNTALSTGFEDLKEPPLPEEVTPGLSWRLRSTDGRESDLADFRERVLFVNFWATWCAPCIAEMPHIEELAGRMSNSDVAFLIVSEEEPDEVVPFVEEQGWQLPIYTTEDVPSTFRTDFIPTTYVLVDRRETVFMHAGAARWDDEHSVDFMEDLLRSTVQ